MLLKVCLWVLKRRWEEIGKGGSNITRYCYDGLRDCKLTESLGLAICSGMKKSAPAENEGYTSIPSVL